MPRPTRRVGARGPGPCPAAVRVANAAAERAREEGVGPSQRRPAPGGTSGRNTQVPPHTSPPRIPAGFALSVTARTKRRPGRLGRVRLSPWRRRLRAALQRPRSAEPPAAWMHANPRAAQRRRRRSTARAAQRQCSPTSWCAAPLQRPRSAEPRRALAPTLSHSSAGEPRNRSTRRGSAGVPNSPPGARGEGRVGKPIKRVPVRTTVLASKGVAVHSRRVASHSAGAPGWLAPRARGHRQVQPRIGCAPGKAGADLRAQSRRPCRTDGGGRAPAKRRCCSASPPRRPSRSRVRRARAPHVELRVRRARWKPRRELRWRAE